MLELSEGCVLDEMVLERNRTAGRDLGNVLLAVARSSSRVIVQQPRASSPFGDPGLRIDLIGRSSDRFDPRSLKPSLRCGNSFREVGDEIQSVVREGLAWAPVTAEAGLEPFVDLSTGDPGSLSSSLDGDATFDSGSQRL